MADNDRQDGARSQIPGQGQVPGQGPGQGTGLVPGPGFVPGPAPGGALGGVPSPAPGRVPGPMPGPGMMPWGGALPGGVPPQGAQQFPQGGPERRVQQAPQGGAQQGGSQQLPQAQTPPTPQKRPGFIEPDWKPSGSTLHDRVLELIQRHLDSALQDARGIQGMMMRDGANRMYPRIEASIRGMSEEELKSEIAAIQSQMRKVLGPSEAKGKSSKASTVKRRGRKQTPAGRR